MLAGVVLVAAPAIKGMKLGIYLVKCGPIPFTGNTSSSYTASYILVKWGAYASEGGKSSRIACSGSFFSFSMSTDMIVEDSIYIYWNSCFNREPSYRYMSMYTNNLR